ncbi:MAG: hypothetical protein KC978_24245 [Candidatus Omnitrophica bacterium]|nr:hypothetical protein [Candidatus Omnitrophota bacterium]
MPKPKPNPNDPEMLDEYDFSDGVRGKYADRFREGTNLIKLDEDVARLFPDSKSVNEALRAIAGIIEGQTKTTP